MTSSVRVPYIHIRLLGHVSLLYFGSILNNGLERLTQHNLIQCSSP